MALRIVLSALYDDYYIVYNHNTGLGDLSASSTLQFLYSNLLNFTFHWFPDEMRIIDTFLIFR